MENKVIKKENQAEERDNHLKHKEGHHRRKMEKREDRKIKLLTISQVLIYHQVL